MNDPLITLTTDFGQSDYFVGAMKGVILSICPTARIIDISHDVEPFSIVSGAFLLSQSVPLFPEATIHVAVVDPGVGTSRRPLLVKCGSQFLIGPDNGLFSLLYGTELREIRQLTATEYFRSSTSTTFHGRDVFAPVAAHLATGLPIAAVGPVIDEPVRLPDLQPVETQPGLWQGQILHCDRFGNLVTNFHESQFRPALSKGFRLRLGVSETRLLGTNYGEQPPGMIFAVFGSASYLEIVMNASSARLRSRANPGMPVTLELPNA